MDSHLVVLKSPRGRQALAERTPVLDVLARRVLILADGRHDLLEIARQLGRPVIDPELAAAVSRLLEGGLVLARDDADDPGDGKPARRHGWRRRSRPR